MNSSIGEQTVKHANDRREPMELNSLRQMDLDQRLDWMREKFRQRIGLLFLRVDGYLVACGTEEEFDDILARFLMFIARSTMLQDTPQGLLQPYFDRLKQLGLKDPGLWVMCCNSHEWILFNSKELNGGNKSFATWGKVEEYVKAIVAQTTDTESETKGE